MSRGSPNTGIKSVLDEENFVDRKRKEQILSLRQSVDEYESELFFGVAQDQLTPDEAVSLWHDAVRRYLMAFEPLLRREDIPNSDYYYTGIELGAVTVEPPEKYRTTPSVRGKSRSNDVLLAQSKPPKPKTTDIEGLKTVIEKEIISEEWSVRVDRARSPGPSTGPPIETVTVEESEQMPRSVLRNAVRAGDEFLEKAGVGLQTGVEQVDVEADPY